MKSFAKIAVLAALSVASAVAFAAPITGSGAVSGMDTFSYNSSTNVGTITFNPTTGFFFGGTGSMTAFNFSTVNLTSFNSTTAAGTTIFSSTNAANNTLSFTVTQLLSTAYTNSPSLTFAGNGYFNETGYDQTAGNFSLTTSTSANGQTSITSFTLNGVAATAVTPEPSSLMLLGTGLMGAAGTMLRRRRIQA